VLATAPAHPPIDVSLGDPNVLRAVLGGALYVTACGLLGFALAPAAPAAVDHVWYPPRRLSMPARMLWRRFAY
jgi:hypothetical protein